MVEVPTVQQSASRILKLAWVCAAVSVAVMVGVVMTRGWPGGLLDFASPSCVSPEASQVVAAVLALTAYFAGPRLLLRFAGRPWRLARASSIRMDLPSLEAQARAESALAKLVSLGYEVSPLSPLDGGGWHASARRRRVNLLDVRRLPQSLEFRYDRGALEIVHRLGALGFQSPEAGEANYQKWFLAEVLRDGPMGVPPPFLTAVAGLIFCEALAAAVAAASLHGGAPGRGAWAEGVGIHVWSLVVGMPVFILVQLAVGRHTLGKRTLFPAVLLAAVAWVLWHAR